MALGRPGSPEIRDSTSNSASSVLVFPVPGGPCTAMRHLSVISTAAHAMSKLRARLTRGQTIESACPQSVFTYSLKVMYIITMLHLKVFG